MIKTTKKTNALQVNQTNSIISFLSQTKTATIPESGHNIGHAPFFPLTPHSVLSDTTLVSLTFLLKYLFARSHLARSLPASAPTLIRVHLLFVW